MWLPIGRQDVTIEVGAAIAEQTPGRAPGSQVVEVETCYEHGFTGVVGGLDQLARGAGNEGNAIKRHGKALALFSTDPARGNQGHEIGTSMILHDAPPMVAAIEGGIQRLRADGCGIKQNLRALKGEQFPQQYDLGAASGRLAHHGLGSVHVVRPMRAASELRCRQGQFSHLSLHGIRCSQAPNAQNFAPAWDGRD
jgi:hypothetical protein